MTFARRIAATWQRYWFEPQSALDLALIRITFFGYIYYRYAWPDTNWRMLRESDYWQPVSFFALGVEVPSYDWLQVIYAVFSVSLLCSALGFLTRVSTWVATATGLFCWGLAQNFGKYTGGGVDIIVFVMGGFALSRCGDYLSVDSWLRAARYSLGDFGSATKNWLTPPAANGEYRWPIRFSWLMFFILYTSAGVSKLTTSGLEWALSDNLRNLLIRHQYSHFPPTEIGLWVAQSEWLYKSAGLGALFFETFCMVGMLNRWLRLLFVAALLGMQLVVRLSMGVTFWGVAVLGWVFIPWTRLFQAAQWALLRRKHALT